MLLKNFGSKDLKKREWIGGGRGVCGGSFFDGVG